MVLPVKLSIPVSRHSSADFEPLLKPTEKAFDFALFLLVKVDHALCQMRQQIVNHIGFVAVNVYLHEPNHTRFIANTIYTNGFLRQSFTLIGGVVKPKDGLGIRSISVSVTFTPAKRRL